ncbi:MAG: response regulator [Clostridiales bacterium]|nr:response regulator [Clostridiales bacterium]
MKIIVMDDERLQLDTILDYIAELYPDDEVRGFTGVSGVLDYARENTADVAILDISMPGNINGISLGEMLRQKNKRIKLLYCTGHADYAVDAFRMHANGYLQKPIRKEELAAELQYVLQMPVYGNINKPYIHTFGNFDVFVDDCPVTFKRSKSKEILAYLADREGSWVSNRELAAVLWEENGSDQALSKYITVLVRSLILDLEHAGAGHIVERKRGNLRLVTGEVECDYYDYLKGDSQAASRFHNEYMNQYSWAENTLASLLPPL